ncbi:MAG: phosphatidylglycerophosphatase A [Candidatus Babeliales bacterium]
MKHIMNRFFLTLSTMGPIGYFKAPGTMASLFSLPIIFCMHRLSLPMYLMVVVLSFCIAFIGIKKSLLFFKKHDPSEIVIDEYVGCLVTFLAFPKTLVTLFWGFIFFRFFDIAKCWGIKSCERLHGALGVLCDDVLAGVFANIFLHIFFFLMSYV